MLPVMKLIISTEKYSRVKNFFVSVGVFFVPLDHCLSQSEFFVPPFFYDIKNKIKFHFFIFSFPTKQTHTPFLKLKTYNTILSFLYPQITHQKMRFFKFDGPWFDIDCDDSEREKMFQAFNNYRNAPSGCLLVAYYVLNLETCDIEKIRRNNHMGAFLLAEDIKHIFLPDNILPQEKPYEEIDGILGFLLDITESNWCYTLNGFECTNRNPIENIHFRGNQYTKDTFYRLIRTTQREIVINQEDQLVLDIHGSLEEATEKFDNNITTWVGNRVIDASRYKIGDDGIKTLIDSMIKTNSYTKSLFLSVNDFGKEGVQSINRLLGSDSTLKKLSLSFNNIDDEKMCILFASFKSKVLETLDLSFNKIGIGSISPLSNIFANNRSLTKIDLSGNFIDDETMLQLSRIFCGDKVLEHIDLSGNLIGDKGVIYFCSCLRSNRSIHHVDLSQNLNITNQSLDAIRNLFEENNTLKVLDMSDNRISFNEVQKLRRSTISNN